MLAVTEVSLESFQIRPGAKDGGVVLAVSGTGDMAAVPALTNCLSQVRQTMKDPELSVLEVDIRGLYLLNSSCIKALVHFIYLVDSSGSDFTIEFVVDKNITWQPRALAALCRMAPALVTVTRV